MKIFNNQEKLGVAGLFMALNSIAVIAIGVLIYPILKQYNQSVALGYFAARIVEATVLAIGIIGILTLIPISKEISNAADSDILFIFTLGNTAIQTNWYSYNFAMIVLGLGSILFCLVLLRFSLVPKVLSCLGLLGYFILAAGSMLSIIGFNIGLYITIPVFLFEVILGVWLLTKGFSFPEKIEERTFGTVNNA
ncbi:DUF4386 domain-containing protein [Microbulbifer sp. 2201CG32-9]|uniref:DUF4386 domain-containing protein n=1 Tax=Microbulbifer sp. 2201CG32-9 TaxID=3232309 RepID=UPI00345C0D3F